jgi:hypothetical protein
VIKRRFDAHPLGWVWLRLVMPADGLGLVGAALTGAGGWPPSSRIAVAIFAGFFLGPAGYQMVRWFWAVEVDEGGVALIFGTGRRERLRYEELRVIQVGSEVGSARRGLMTVETADRRRTGVRVTGEDELLAELAERAPLASFRAADTGVASRPRGWDTWQQTVRRQSEQPADRSEAARYPTGVIAGQSPFSTAHQPGGLWLHTSRPTDRLVRPGRPHLGCPAPGLLEALNPREDESHGGTEEVPR